MRSTLANNCCRQRSCDVRSCWTSVSLSLFALCVLTLWLTSARPVSAQGPGGPGIPPFATLTESPYDRINLANGGLTFTFPIRSKTAPLSYSLDLTGSTNLSTYRNTATGIVSWNGYASGALAGWLSNQEFTGPASQAAWNDTMTVQTCGTQGINQQQYYQYDNIVVIDSTGAIHATNVPSFYSIPCGPVYGTSPATLGGVYQTTDQSGYTLVNTSTYPGVPEFDVYDRSGNELGTNSGGRNALTAYNTAMSPNGTTLSSISGTISFNPQTNVTSETSTYIDAYSQQFLKSSYNPSSYSFSYSDSVGNTQSATVAYANYTQQTYFNCPGIAESNFSSSLPASITLPNGRMFTLTYEPTPNHPSNITGRLASIGLPDGGSITYQYTNGSSGVYCDTATANAQGNESVTVPTLTRTFNDGNGHSSGWAYTFSDPIAGQRIRTTEILDGQGNYSIYKFYGDYITQSVNYQGGYQAGIVLKTVLTCYNAVFTNCDTGSSYPSQNPFPNGITQTDVYTSYSSGAPSLVETKINTYGLPTEVKQYDYGAAMPPTGSPLTDTITTYGTWNGSGCVAISSYINDRPCEVTVKNGTSIVSDTRNTYDSKGNLTQTAKLATGSTYVTQSFTYNPNGSIKTSTDGNSNLVSFTENACNNLLPTAIVNGILTIQETWDCNGGVLTSTSGPNPSQTTQIAYLDPFYRQTKTTSPDGGYTAVCYSDVGGPTCSQSATLNTTSFTTIATPDPNIISSVTYDGLGRAIKSISPSGAETDTTYDVLGNTMSISNPYFTTGDQSYGITSFLYDAIGRVLYQCDPDNATSATTVCVPGNDYKKWVYSANATNLITDTFDEAGNRMEDWSDGLGRLKKVFEPTSAGMVPSVETDYSYDVLGNVLSIIQLGEVGTTPTGFSTVEASKSHTFTYDALSRIVTSSTPESGKICYGTLNGTTCQEGYDGNSNLWHKTDARGVVLNFTYDFSNRILSEASSDSSVMTSYTYDNSTLGSNQLGQLSTATHTGTAGTVYYYDVKGRISSTKYFDPHSGGTQTGMGLAYDLADNVTSLTYPDGRQIAQAFNAGGQLANITSGSVTYISGGSGLPISYSASGVPSRFTLGNGVLQSSYFNNRLQPCSSGAITPPLASRFSTSILSRSAYYHSAATSNCGNEPGNNGNVYALMDGLNTNWSQAFTYDSLNRLTSGVRLDSGYSHTYNYDSFGNLAVKDNLHTNPTWGIDPASNELLFNPTGGTDGCGHETSTYIYDCAGNMTSSGPAGHTYTYNALSQITAVDSGNTATYAYDGMNERVVKNAAGSVWTEYIYLNGQPMALHSSSGTWTDIIYANGKKIAKTVSQVNVLDLHGVRTSANTSCGVEGAVGGVPAGVAGLIISSGDVLLVDIQQTLPTYGGLALIFTNGTGTGALIDSVTGVPLYGDSLADGNWHHMSGSLGAYVGLTVSYALAGIHQNTPNGTFDLRLASAVILHSNGSVTPIFTGQAGTSVANFSGTNCGGSSLSAGTAILPTTDPAINSTYFVNDYLGTAQMETSVGGWPVWEAQFTPFGVELDTSYTSMGYRYTGQERDSETGLDNFGARYYGSSIGRFVSPDPSGLAFADPTNPQGFNLYSYVINSPLRFVDPTGLWHCVWDSNTGDQDDTHENGGASEEECDQQYGNWTADAGDADALEATTGGKTSENTLNSNTTENTQTGGVSYTMSGAGYDPDAANLYMFSVYLTADADHSFGCIAKAEGYGGMEGAPLQYMGQPYGGPQNFLNRRGTGLKRFAASDASQDTSIISDYLSGVNFKDALNIPAGTRFPSITGGPFTGKMLSVKPTANLGRALGRAAPIVGGALTAYSSIQLWRCL